ncbi:MAG: 3'-5' exonuclease [Phaeodactylibacter sp.]|nr:3'-5' exonuclease [Phaeodactylibacter sp.]MCB9274287.1 3'-5' exonuclease [Lewinellaceae bacterium]
MEYLVVDLEMTGGDPSWHEIISIGAVLYSEQWVELGRYSSLVYPENEEAFSKPSEAVHGISLQDLQDAPMLDDVLPEFEEWILSCRHLKPGAFDNSNLLKHTMISGLGIVNDFAFLKAAYGIVNRNWPYSYRLLDMQTLTHTLYPVFREAGINVPSRQSLDAIAGFFGLQRESGEHDALEDALLTGHCFQELMKMVQKLKYFP